MTVKSTTRSLKPGDHFIDFKQVEYGEKDSLLFSDIAGQGHPVCLLFFLKPNEKDAVRTEIKNLREQYPDIRVIVPTHCQAYEQNCQAYRTCSGKSVRRLLPVRNSQIH